MMDSFPCSSPSATTNRARTEAEHRANGNVTRSVPPSSTISTITREGEETPDLSSPVTGSGTLAEAPLAAASASFLLQSNQKRRRDRRGQPLLVGRPCGHCGKELTRGDGESRGHFNERRFCGNSCAQSAREPKPLPTKHCKFCGTQLTPRENETGSNFRKRFLCNYICRNASVRKGINERMAVRSAENAAARFYSGGSFPKAQDAHRIAEIYGTERYDAPGRVVDPGFAPRMSSICEPKVFVQSTAGMAAI